MAKIKSLLSDSHMKPENIKANITIRMSLDVLDAYREKAKQLGIGYQTLMQMKLREALENETQLAQRIENLERLIGNQALPLRSPTRSTKKHTAVKRARKK